MATPGGEAKRQPLHPRFGDILWGVYCRRLSDKLPRFPPPVSGAWAHLDLAQHVGHIEAQGSRLKLVMNARTDDEVGRLRDMMNVANQPLAATLADGSALVAKFAHMRTVSFPSGRAVVELWNWRWQPATVPRIWIGVLKTLPGARFFRPNTVFRDPDNPKRFAVAALRLDGQRRWFLFQTGKEGETLAVVCAKDHQDQTKIYEDLRCLEFVCGTPIRCDAMVGFDDKLKRVAAFEVGRRTSTMLFPGRPPIFHEFHGTVDRWEAEFFRLLCARVRAKKVGSRSLFRGLGCYVNATALEYETNYLIAQVGLEAVLRLTMGKPPVLPSYVNSLAQWNSWVTSKRKEVLPHLTQASHWEDFVCRALLLAHKPKQQHPSPMPLLRSLFDREGLSVTPEMARERKKRDDIVHEFIAVKGKLKLPRDINRRNLVLAMLVSIIALDVGFKGPIAGPKFRNNGFPPPTWWRKRMKGERVEDLPLWSFTHRGRLRPKKR